MHRKFQLQDLWSCALAWRCQKNHRTSHNYTGVPLPTKRGISLIILKLMKILQRDLNRSTFVVWEMWHHNVLEVVTTSVQTELNPARRIFESPCQYVCCHCLNSFGEVCFQGVYGSWFGKLSLSYIPIRNNEAALDRASVDHSPFEMTRSPTEFRPCWRVKCGMSL